MILLDTNVVSETMRGEPEPRVIVWLDAQAAETIFLSTISLSELLVGVAFLPEGKRKEALADALEHRLAGLFAERIIAFDMAAARAYAVLLARARTAGASIGVADGQIAAIAASRGFAVATRYEAPFRATGVAVVNPWDAS